MTYHGHRRRRRTPEQAPPRASLDRDEPDDLDRPDQADPDQRSTGAPAPVAQQANRPQAPASPQGAAFVAALALAVHDVALDQLDGHQLHRLRAVLAVVAPGLHLTTDPAPQEDPVHTTTPALAAEPADPEPDHGQTPSANFAEGPPAEPEDDDGQGDELADLLADLVAERERTAVVLAQREALLAQAGDPADRAARQVRAIAATRQRAEDERAIAAAREDLAAVRQRTAVTTAHLIVSAAALALAGVGLASTTARALALTAAVPMDELVVARGGRVDVQAAAAVLTAAAVRAAGGAR